MNIKILAGIAILIFIFIMGCSGNYGKVKPQSGSDSKITQRELIDNWSDYDIWLTYHPGIRGETWLAVIFFDPKNDDRKILIKGGGWSKVKDQEMWTEIVKANTNSDGDFRLVYSNSNYTTGVQEIWGPDNQLYGFIIYQQTVVGWVDVKLVDENTVRVRWERLVGTSSAPSSAP